MLRDQVQPQEQESGIGALFSMLLEAFDTCVYCGGKYRP